MIFPPPASCCVDTKPPQFLTQHLDLLRPTFAPRSPSCSSPSCIASLLSHCYSLYFQHGKFTLFHASICTSTKRRTIRQSSPSVIYARQSTTLKLDLLFADMVANRMRCVFTAAQYHRSPAFYTFTTRFQIAICSTGIETHLIKVPVTERRIENAHGARTVRRKRKGSRDV